jgi:predicted S18 family serine protease
MAQMTPQVSKLLEEALSLSVEEQEALADSLISSLGGKVDEASGRLGMTRSRNASQSWMRAGQKPFPGPKFAIAI